MVVAVSDQSNAQESEATPAYKKVRRKKSERFATVSQTARYLCIAASETLASSSSPSTLPVAGSIK
jgi:hypothetical protein